MATATVGFRVRVLNFSVSPPWSGLERERPDNSDELRDGE